MTIKHNKKKNTSIVYEQLMIVMANLLSENKKEEFDVVKNLLVKHFNKSSNLSKEKKIFDSLMSFKNKDMKMSERFLDECLVESSLISEQELEKEKVLLINEIIETIGKEVFNIPVKNYKLRASAQFLLNEMRNNLKYSSPKDRLKLKLYLVESFQKEEVNSDVGKIDNITFKLLKNKYIKKYSSVLNENQQKIIVKWNDYLSNQNENSFSSFLSEEYKKINKELNKYILNNSKNSNIDLLKEAYNKTKNVSLNSINEQTVYEVMRFWDIVEDLNMENNSNV